MRVIDKENIQIEIWERGAGYTMASGSSSCAAASIARKLGLVGSKVDVHMPGGIISIEIQDDYFIYMTGVATGIMQGDFHEEFKKKLS